MDSPDNDPDDHPFHPAPDAPAGPSVFVLGINRNPPPEAAAAPLGEFIRGAVAEAASRPPMFTKPPPPSASGLDLNFCKSTACQNFGNPASAAASGYSWKK